MVDSLDKVLKAIKPLDEPAMAAGLPIKIKPVVKL